MKNYILITGASSGVGRETAIHLSKNNNLILNGRDETRLQETKDLCEKNSDVLIWKFDLVRSDKLEEDFSSWLREKNIQIESLVYSAGMLRMLPLRGLSLEDFQRIYSLHVYSPALLVKMLNSRKINKQTLKNVVFISSNISNRGAAAFSAYGSSKAALDGLMRNLAVELAPKVRLNSILPGGMVTRMTTGIYNSESILEDAKKNVPLGQGSPKDIAPVVEFLLSPASAWMTGQQITVDGGRTIDITDGRK
ncbi:MAG: SDR family oxidoreductase [Selenomonadaceae bacterium]|nr:SDR family oxidoreductase [Selenomonadaceae bacterium]